MANKELINELLERDKPMPMGRYEFKYVEAEPFDMCGKCGSVIHPNVYIFCPYCGQRIDPENYKL